MNKQITHSIDQILRRKRKTYTFEQRALLEHIYMQTKYPSQKEKLVLSRILQLTLREEFKI